MGEDTKETFTFTEKLHSSIRLGDFLLLEGRPCQVIRITGPSDTGRSSYRGVDFFTKQIHEEASFTSTFGPEQAARALDLKPWRVLDLAEGSATVMDDEGNVKQGMEVIDQGNLYSRMQQAFESGRGSVRGLVLSSDGGRHFIVEMEVAHGKRL